MRLSRWRRVGGAVGKRVEHGPDPSRPPLQAVFGRDDQGGYSADIKFGGITPARGAQLLVGAAWLLMSEAGACEHMTAFAGTLNAELIIDADRSENPDDEV